MSACSSPLPTLTNPATARCLDPRRGPSLSTVHQQQSTAQCVDFDCHDPHSVASAVFCFVLDHFEPFPVVRGVLLHVIPQLPHDLELQFQRLHLHPSLNCSSRATFMASPAERAAYSFSRRVTSSFLQILTARTTSRYRRARSDVTASTSCRARSDVTESTSTCSQVPVDRSACTRLRDDRSCSV